MPTAIKFLVDESTGQATVDYLRQQGFDVFSVAEEMPQASDEEILAQATISDRILVTNDKDFGELIYRSGKKHVGVILLRLQDESSENRLRVIRAIIENHLERLQDRFVVATEKRLRIRTGGL